MKKEVIENVAMKTYSGLLSGEIGRSIVDEATETMKQNAVDEDPEGLKYLETNNSWDELLTLHANFVVLLRTHAAHSVSARNKELMTRVSNIPQYITCLKALLTHMRLLSSELKDLYNLHKDMSGGARTQEEVMRNVDIYGMYILFQERHEAILVPTSNILCELVSEAEDKLNEEGLTGVVDGFREDMNNFINGFTRTAPTISPEQDPKVITDVEPTEIK